MAWSTNGSVDAVSYTHLDVYKRQVEKRTDKEDTIQIGLKTIMGSTRMREEAFLQIMVVFQRVLYDDCQSGCQGIEPFAAGISLSDSQLPEIYSRSDASGT